MRYLLTIDGISFYASALSIKNGVGQTESVNTAARMLLQELKDNRKRQGVLRKTVGCGGTGYQGHNAQIFLMRD